MSFLDQDDYFQRGMRSALAEVDLRRGRGAVVGNVVVVDVTSGQLRTNRLWPRKREHWRTAALDLMLEMAQIGRWVIATDLARQCAFIPDLWHADDLAFLAQVASATNVLSVPYPVAAYRVHPAQTSVKQPRMTTADEEGRVEAILQTAAHRRHGPRAVRRRLAARKLYHKGMMLRMQGAAGQAFAAFCCDLSPRSNHVAVCHGTPSIG